jgi:hypothetical protein
VSRFAAAVTALVAIALFVTPAPSRTFLIGAGVVLLAAAIAGFFQRREHAAEQPTTNHQPPTTISAVEEPKEKEGTVLVAEVITGPGGERLQDDLRRVLAGIAYDEKGTVTKGEGAERMQVTFRGRRNHAAAAIHAAQRMLSNVDAVSRRLEREIQIRIGVNTGAIGSDSLADTAVEIAKLTREKRLPVLFSESAFKSAGDAAKALAQADEQPMPLYGFVPLQRSLF